MPSSASQLPYAATLVRFTLAASFLSAVADRLGIWSGLGSSEVAWGDMQQFLAYTQLLLWYVPVSLANSRRYKVVTESGGSGDTQAPSFV
ncbi:hypothetical protein [Blastopirellula retiformator]|uniref:hypothetical protein n=1 Tax=Blastopirellula retiformator TaxID=2527970 RepID=UPI001646066D|nr:hypothetical protein [Blastopirellula retiformator]